MSLKVHYKICIIYIINLAKLNFLVYYSEKDSVVPKSREEVWNEINGAPNLMDKNGIFFPEYNDYHVVQIVLFKDGEILISFYTN